MNVPEGLQQDSNSCLLLKKTIYGLVQSAREFYNKLLSTLKSMGFTKNKSDPCLLSKWTNFVLLKIRGIKILPFLSLPYGYLDYEPKGIIYRITLFVSELLVDLCKCECDRVNGSSFVISQLLVFCLSDPPSMLSIQPDMLICVESLFSLLYGSTFFYVILKSLAEFKNNYMLLQ
jgi:hypothetical protein